MTKAFEKTGWTRIDISASALDLVEKQTVALGIPVETLDITPFVAGFRAYMELPQYSSGYRNYGGAEFHCLQEKALEHYLSFAFAAPQPGQVAVDIGSCKSVVPDILRTVYRVRCYEQDLVYPPGVSGDQVGSSADSIPLPDASVDFMTLHCTFEHFEGNADTGFVRECARLLKPGGRVVILPLYLNANHCNVTGENDPSTLDSIGFDPDAQYHCSIPEWQNRFGRHYSPSALLSRVIQPARAAGLQPLLLRCVAWDQVDPRLWLRWILVLEQPATSDNVMTTTRATTLEMNS